MAPAEPHPTRAPHQVPTPAISASSAVPRLWPALPPETRRRLAQELARLLGPTRTRSRTIAAPMAAGTEATHADHTGPR
jgi:hypothetical protein